VTKRLLTSRHVLGDFSHLGEWLEGTHEPIIDRVTWNAAQAHGERGRKYAPRGGGRLPKRHVFVRGALRCGCCGEAMLPRSANDQADVYVCRTRKGDATACPMPPVKRDVVDGAALSLFESWALDVEGTRDRIATTIDARLAEIRAQAARAGREVSEKRVQLARVERDYLAGELGAVSHDRLAGRMSEELTAAEAEQARLDEHAADVADLRANLDAEHEALRRLALLRSAVCERVGRAAADAREHADIAAVRSAMAAVFSEVRLVPAGHHPASDAAVRRVAVEAHARQPLRRPHRPRGDAAGRGVVDPRSGHAAPRPDRALGLGASAHGVGLGPVPTRQRAGSRVRREALRLGAHRMPQPMSPPLRGRSMYSAACSLVSRMVSGQGPTGAGAHRAHQTRRDAPRAPAACRRPPGRGASCTPDDTRRAHDTRGLPPTTRAGRIVHTRRHATRPRHPRPVVNRPGGGASCTPDETPRAQGTPRAARWAR
jgi:hypothetical protein